MWVVENHCLYTTLCGGAAFRYIPLVGNWLKKSGQRKCVSRLENKKRAGIISCPRRKENLILLCLSRFNSRNPEGRDTSAFLSTIVEIFLATKDLRQLPFGCRKFNGLHLASQIMACFLRNINFMWDMRESNALAAVFCNATDRRMASVGFRHPRLVVPKNECRTFTSPTPPNSTLLFSSYI